MRPPSRYSASSPFRRPRWRGAAGVKHEDVKHEEEGETARTEYRRRRALPPGRPPCISWPAVFLYLWCGRGPVQRAVVLSLKQIVLRHSIVSRSVHAFRAVVRRDGAPAALPGAWHLDQGFLGADPFDHGSNLRLALFGQFAGHDEGGVIPILNLAAHGTAA